MIGLWIGFGKFYINWFGSGLAEDLPPSDLALMLRGNYKGFFTPANQISYLLPQAEIAVCNKLKKNQKIYSVVSTLLKSY